MAPGRTPGNARSCDARGPIFGKIARPPQSCRAPDLGPALLVSVGLAVLKTLGRLYVAHPEATHLQVVGGPVGLPVSSMSSTDSSRRPRPAAGRSPPASGRRSRGSHQHPRHHPTARARTTSLGCYAALGTNTRHVPQDELRAAGPLVGRPRCGRLYGDDLTVGAVKELTNRSTPDSTRYPRPRAVTASYFNARPRVHADNGPGHPRAGPPRGSSAGCGRRRAGPSTLALLTVSFAEGRERTRAVAYYGAVAGVGASFGRLLGGILTDLISWRVGFFSNLPIGLAMILAAARYLPETTRVRGCWMSSAGSPRPTPSPSPPTRSRCRCWPGSWSTNRAPDSRSCRCGCSPAPNGSAATPDGSFSSAP